MRSTARQGKREGWTGEEVAPHDRASERPAPAPRTSDRWGGRSPASVDALSLRRTKLGLRARSSVDSTGGPTLLAALPSLPPRPATAPRGTESPPRPLAGAQAPRRSSMRRPGIQAGRGAWAGGWEGRAGEWAWRGGAVGGRSWRAGEWAWRGGAGAGARRALGGVEGVRGAAVEAEARDAAMDMPGERGALRARSSSLARTCARLCGAVGSRLCRPRLGWMARQLDRWLERQLDRWLGRVTRPSPVFIASSSPLTLSSSHPPPPTLTFSSALCCPSRATLGSSPGLSLREEDARTAPSLPASLPRDAASSAALATIECALLGSPRTAGVGEAPDSPNEMDPLWLLCGRMRGTQLHSVARTTGARETLEGR